eukprot:TRINITY_DN46059_c0_g1_i1.p1 TRINITY_DN46059_c0_g1~~TRINITY_DN46059_c0_g1_i1.p1  ORF type:complete len:888 (-),score=234.98 TRINITY_DN46059_c0_g1_i1:80-2743(-)
MGQSLCGGCLQGLLKDAAASRSQLATSSSRSVPVLDGTGLRGVENKEEYDFAQQQQTTSRLLEQLGAGTHKQGSPGGHRLLTTQNSRRFDLQTVARSPSADVVVQLPVTLQHAEVLRKHYELKGGGAKPISNNVYDDILQEFMKSYAATFPSPIAEVAVPPGGRVIVVGDTHGQLQDVLLLFRKHGPPSKTNVYVFNGDIADRGQNACEIFALLMVYHLAEPGCITINRGNHEDTRMNTLRFDQGGGFYDEVVSKFDVITYGLFQAMFRVLSLSTIVGEKVMVLHGGIGTVMSLDEIREEDRSIEQPDCDSVTLEIMWSDPCNKKGSRPSPRGLGQLFGPDRTRKFLLANPPLELLVRSHEVPADGRGCEEQHDGLLWTVFSASNYCGDEGNLGGVLLFFPEDFPRPHPDHYFAPTLDMIAELSAGDHTLDAWIATGQAYFDTLQEELEEVHWRKEWQKLMVQIVENKPEIWRAYLDVTQGAAFVDFKTWRHILSSVLGHTWNWKQAWLLANSTNCAKVNFVDFLRRFSVVLTRSEYMAFKFKIVANVYEKVLMAETSLREALRVIDADGDGAVSAKELRCVLTRTDSGLTPSQVDCLVHAVLAETPDGKTPSISIEEFVGRFTLLYKHAEEVLTEESHTEEARLLSEAMAKVGRLLAVTPLEKLVEESSAGGQGYCPPSAGSSTRTSGILAHKLLALYNICDADHNGLVGLDEFVKALSGLAEHYDIKVSSGQQLESLLMKMAKRIDRTESGSINIWEFVSAFSVDDATARKQENFADSLAENILSVLLRHRASIRAAALYFDRDGTGKISRADAQRILETLNDIIWERGGGWSVSQIRHFCDALAFEGDGGKQFIEYESVFDSFEVVDAEDAKIGVRLGRRQHSR